MQVNRSHIIQLPHHRGRGNLPKAHEVNKPDSLPTPSVPLPICKSTADLRETLEVCSRVWTGDVSFAYRPTPSTSPPIYLSTKVHPFLSFISSYRPDSMFIRHFTNMWLSRALMLTAVSALLIKERTSHFQSIFHI